MTGWVVRTGSCGVLGIALLGCGNCDFEFEQVKRFVRNPANSQCVTTNDCVTQFVPGCFELEEAVCGQIVMSKAAAQSSQWQGITTDASDCGSDSCASCTLLRTATCDQGTCK